VPPPTPLVLMAPLIPWPRFESLADGAVQLGVTDFWGWEAERARPLGRWSALRITRLERIARAATTQSLGCHAPRIQAPRPLPELLDALVNCALWIAHGPLPAGGDPPLAPVGGVREGRALVVGPEGGLSDRELELCLAAGARCLSLGPRRLRTEVAAIAGLTALQATDPGWGR